MKKLYFLISYVFLYSITFSQNNLIPNGGFELGSPAPTCNYSVTPSDFESSILNWKIATHNIDKGQGTPDWFSISCESSISYYGNFIPPQSNRWVAITADLKKCTDGLFGNCNVETFHEAIFVGLLNGASFVSGRKYIIRYKIEPIRARNLDNQGLFSCCVPKIETCHLRVFLSELGINWNDNSSTKEEIYNANYLTNISLSNNNPTTYTQVEKYFTCSASNLRNLVFYVESGGFMLDDIEVFEECGSTYDINDKTYYYDYYQQNSVNGQNFAEKSGGVLNVSNVQVNSGTFITYTAADEIKFLNDIEIHPTSNFKAVIAPCPNSIFRESGNPNNLVNPIPSKTEIKKEETKDIKNQSDELNVFPNPNNGEFKLTLSDKIELPKSIVISDILGREIQNISNPTSYEHVFDLKNMNEGLYIVNVFYLDRTMSKRIIKN